MLYITYFNIICFLLICWFLITIGWCFKTERGQTVGGWAEEEGWWAECPVGGEAGWGWHRPPGNHHQHAGTHVCLRYSVHLKWMHAGFLFCKINHKTDFDTWLCGIWITRNKSFPLAECQWSEERDGGTEATSSGGRQSSADQKEGHRPRAGRGGTLGAGS